MSPGPIIVIKDEPDDEDDVRFVRVESLKIGIYVFLFLIVSTNANFFCVVFEPDTLSPCYCC